MNLETSSTTTPQLHDSQQHPLRVENPDAIYQDPPKETPSSRFRAFANRSKTLMYGIVLVAMAGGIAASMRSVTGLDGRLESYFQRFAGKPPGGGYQVAASQVDESELRLSHAIHERLAGPVDYRLFVQEQFETDLVLRAALDEGMLSTPEAAMILETALRRAAADYYMRKKYSADLAPRQVTAGEAKLLYEKTKGAMKNQFLGESEAVASIRNTLIAVQAQEFRAKQLLLRRELTNRLKQIYSTTAPEAVK